MTSLWKLWQLRRSLLANHLVVLLMLFGIGPLAVFYLISQQFFIAHETTNIRRAQQQAISCLAGQVTHALEQKRSVLQGVSGLGEGLIDPEVIRRWLDRLRRTYPEFLDLQVYHYFRPTGALEPITPAHGATRGENQPCARFTITWTGNDYQTAMNPAGQASLLALRLPFPLAPATALPTGEVVGLVNWQVFLEDLQKRFPPQEYTIALLTTAGQVLGQLGRRQSPPLDLTQTPPVQALAQGHTGVWEYADAQGHRVLAATALVPGTDLAIILIRPGELAFQQLHRIVLVFFSLFSLVILLAIFRGLLFSHDRIIKPVKDLQREIESLTQGVFPQGIKAIGKDEIGHLSLAFNKMLDCLKKTMVSRERLAQEVAERQKVEEALRQREATLRSLFVAVPVGIGSLRNWQLTAANDSFYKIAGYDPETLLQQELLPLFCDPANYTNLRSHLQSSLNQTEAVMLETQWCTQDRQKKDIFLKFAKVAASPAMDLVFAAMDVSDLKKMEQERLRIAKLESLGILAGGIAHDFNNILTIILGNLELLHLENCQDPQSARFLSEAHEACRRAQHLAKQLLTFAKGGNPIKKPLDPVQLLKEVIPLSLSGAQAAVTIATTEPIWAIEADEDQMHQVLNNILLNAVQSMPQGGMITVTVENITLTPAHHLPLPPGRYVKIAIADQGCGIAPEDLEKIFDPYYTTKPMGNGLGLTAAHSIIKNHRGHISVNSQVGRGSCFTLYLPVAPVAALPTPVKAAAQLIPGQGRILVMDDEPAVREVLAQMLKKLGYEPVCVAEGQQAVAAYRQAQEQGTGFAAAILDLTIPGGLGGKETLKLLRHLDPDVKAIVSSGYGEDPIMAKYADFGFGGVIAKPYKIADLSEVLYKVLHHPNPANPPEAQPPQGV